MITIKRLSLTALFCFFSVSAYAQLLCEDAFLASLHYDSSKDKTFIKSPNADLTDEKVTTHLLPNIEADVAKAVSQDIDANGKIMAASITYFELTSDPDCQKKADKYSSPCIGKVVDGLSRYKLNSFLRKDDETIGKHNESIQNLPKEERVDVILNSISSLELGKAKVWSRAQSRFMEMIESQEVNAYASQLFGDIKTVFNSVIADKVPDPELREIMRRRIRSVALKLNLQTLACDSYYEGNPGGYARSDSDPLKSLYDVENVQLCPSFFMKGFNLGSLIFIFAHELAHSIDTCAMEEIRSLMNYSGDYPVPGLVSCLAGPMSVGIRTEDGTRTSACPWNNQSVEAVPDWWASEVLSRMLNERKDLSPTDKQVIVAGVVANYSKGFRRIRKGIGKYNPHPLLSRRLNFILMANPTLRTQLGCSPAKDVQYCTGATQPAI